MASEERERRTQDPPHPEGEGEPLDVDDDAAQLSEDDLRGIAAIRRRLDIEFGMLPSAPPPVTERERRPRAPAPASRGAAPPPRAASRAPHAGVPAPSVAAPAPRPAPRAAVARHRPLAAVAALMLLAGGFVGFISAVVTYVMLESSAPTTTAPKAPAPPPAPSASVVAPPTEARPQRVEPSMPAAPPELPARPPAPRPQRVERSMPAAPPELPARAPTLGDLRESLGRWIVATRRRDIDGQMALYPERVDVYYAWRNVSRTTVRREKERVFSGASVLDITTGPPEITPRPDGKTAVTRFRKRYVIEGPRVRRRGEVVQELLWVRTPNGWKITAERDVEVLS